MAAAPLPAARQITLPLGTGRKCADSTTSGCAAATAASKMVRSRGRRSVIALRSLASRDLSHAVPVIHPIAAKENPRGPAAGGCIVSRTRCSVLPLLRRAGTYNMGPGSAAHRWRAALRPGHDRTSAADVAADDIAEQHPALALELHQLKLADRGEVGRRSVDADAGQQHLGAEVLEVSGLLHDVFTGQVVAALFQYLNHGLRDGEADLDRAVELVAFREILGEEVEEFFHPGVVVPLRIGNIFHVSRGNEALRILVTGRLDDTADRGG